MQHLMIWGLMGTGVMIVDEFTTASGKLLDIFTILSVK